MEIKTGRKMAQQDPRYWLGYQIGERLAQGGDVKSLLENVTGPSPLYFTYRDARYNERPTHLLSHYYVYLGILEALESHDMAEPLKMWMHPTYGLSLYLHRRSDKRFPLARAEDLTALASLIMQWPPAVSAPGMVEERWPVEESAGLTALALRHQIPDHVLYSGTQIRVETTVRGAEAALEAILGRDLFRYLRHAL